MVATFLTTDKVRWGCFLGKVFGVNKFSTLQVAFSLFVVFFVVSPGRYLYGGLVWQLLKDPWFLDVQRGKGKGVSSPPKVPYSHAMCARLTREPRLRPEDYFTPPFPPFGSQVHPSKARA